MKIDRLQFRINMSRLSLGIFQVALGNIYHYFSLSISNCIPIKENYTLNKHGKRHTVLKDKDYHNILLMVFNLQSCTNSIILYLVLC